MQIIASSSATTGDTDRRDLWITFTARFTPAILQKVADVASLEGSLYMVISVSIRATKTLHALFFFQGKSWNPWKSHCRLLLTPNMGISIMGHENKSQLTRRNSIS